MATKLDIDATAGAFTEILVRGKERDLTHEELGQLYQMGVGLLSNLFIDVHRIADALEEIAVVKLREKL